MEPTTRTEKNIFDELEIVCKSPGYVHAIAYFCFRDNTIKYTDDLLVEDVLQQFSMERLVRTEISTLIGLACKGDLNLDLPDPSTMQEYISDTDALLLEIHQNMMIPMKEFFDPSKLSDANFNPFTAGVALRESIFYSGEAAYNFQYRDLSLIKYKNDNDWFTKNKGYSVEQAGVLVSTICQIQIDKINNLAPVIVDKDPKEWTIFPAFIFSAEDVSIHSGIDIKVSKSLIESFVVPEEIDKNCFSELGDFNPRNAYPIIKLNDTKYLLFQNYSLVEALYETPFFWFNDDDTYKVTARANRGEFTEIFSEERLKIVFGEDRVFTNIDIYKDKKTRVGEIDVLVIFANRAIVLQAKSKKLTIAARKGNDNCLRDDFKKAVQSAYNQAYQCAELLNNEDYLLVDSNGNELSLPRKYKKIYPFCVLSDHYPALSFQARQFLKYKTTDVIMPPFVMDVFLLDVMTEMLQSPLYFLSYIDRRVEYAERILSNHELTVLSYHLKQNLWVDDDVSMIQLGDDVCADLDLAMLTRRDNAPGIDTPEGILTNNKDTVYGALIREIDSLDDPATINLGFMLLSLNSDTIRNICDGIEQLCSRHAADGKHHDLTLGVDQGKTGVTIHCNSDAPNISIPLLKRHCHARKYKLKANTWFGICIDPRSKKIKFGLNLDFDWERNKEMDDVTGNMSASQHLRKGEKINFETKTLLGSKVGRNDKCPCGSNKKYKKCCLK